MPHKIIATNERLLLKEEAAHTRIYVPRNVADRTENTCCDTCLCLTPALVPLTLLFLALVLYGYEQLAQATPSDHYNDAPS